MVTRPWEVMRMHVRGALESARPGAFDIRAYGSAADARRDLHDQVVYGVLVDGSPPQLLVTGATGEAVISVITGALRKIVAQTGAQLEVRDIRPIGAGDPRGLGIFLLVLGLTLSAVVFRLLFLILARGTPIGVALAAIAVYSVLAGLLATLLVKPVVGVLDGHFLEVAGFATLFSAAVALAAAAIQGLLGIRTAPVIIIVLVILAHASSGSPVNHHLLPDVFRQLSQFMLAGSAATAIRNTVYFDAASVGGPIIVMVTWMVVSVVILVGAARRRPSSRPSPAPPPA